VAFNGTATVGDPVALTTDPAPDFEPRWSPDDRELVFYSRRFGTRDLFTVDADGRGERRITALPGNEYYPDWSPDGKRISFSSQVSYNWDVYVLARDTGSAWSAPHLLKSAATATVNVRWAPDGRSLAIVNDSSLGLLPAEGGDFRLLVDGRALGENITFIAWGRDASRVYFQSRDATGASSFWSVPTAGGSPRRLLRLSEPGRRTRRPEFDTDGRSLFFTVLDDEADVAVVTLTRP
jgi:dipeptidyl aminopeptidase/acylaminoacyl peptidase